MGEAALKIASAAKYYNAGTMEFLADADGNFYFLEMNTRLQVEHPVTELATGIDLVRWQLRIAAGDKLTIDQRDVEWKGSAIECRVYAEDPENNFFPSPGTLTHWREPSGPGIRIDAGVYPGWTVPLEYDPLLAKLAVWAGTRIEAVQRLNRALAETVVSGIKTNIAFFREVLEDPAFRRGDVHTGYIEEFFARRLERLPADADTVAVAALVAAVHQMRSKPAAPAAAESQSRWSMEGRGRLMR